MQKRQATNKWGIGSLLTGGNLPTKDQDESEHENQVAEMLDDLNRMQQATKQLGDIQPPTKPKKRFGLF